MCDEFTRAEEDAALQKRGISRRRFAALGTAAAMAACSKPSRGQGQGQGQGPSTGLPERIVEVNTPDGTADAFFVHPAKGAHPAIVMWPDIAGLREAFKAMARRLAGSGYAVLVVNQYYRSAPAPVFDTFAASSTPEGQARLKPMTDAITPAGTMSDARAFISFLDIQPEVDTRRGIGTCGYCMGGPFAVRTAAAVPPRVAAAASLHGANLVSDDPNSPVNLIARTKAAYLFAIARNDDARAPGDKDALRSACSAAGLTAQIDVFPADHGWCVLDTPVYDKDAAERAWSRMLALFRNL